MKIPENIKHNVEWIEKTHKIKVSKFMLKVLSILSTTFGGLHHTDVEKIWKAKDFINKRHIEYNDFRGNISTYDFSELTKLVLLCHKEGIRFGVGTNRDSTRRKQLILTFSNRMEKRTGSISQRHPTIKQAIRELNI